MATGLRSPLATSCKHSSRHPSGSSRTEPRLALRAGDREEEIRKEDCSLLVPVIDHYQHTKTEWVKEVSEFKCVWESVRTVLFLLSFVRLAWPPKCVPNVFSPPLNWSKSNVLTLRRFTYVFFLKTTLFLHPANHMFRLAGSGNVCT